MNTAVKENVVAVIPPRRKPAEPAAPAAEEKVLEAGSKDITGKVESIIIETEDDYGEAAEYGKRVKAQIKAVKDYWKPLKENAAKAHKEICAREKEMLAPLQEAESTLKGAMSGYLMEREKKRLEQEERMRRLQEAEAERLLNEAVESERNGDAEEAAARMEYAETLATATTVVQGTPTPKVSGVSTSTDWEIESIDASKVPTEVAGVIIRPVDEAAVKRLIRMSKGAVQIPGVVYKKTTKISLGRS